MAWDKSGLKEACQRGLAIGRTKQEFDLQLLLEMLLTIEQLEQALCRMESRVENLANASYTELRPVVETNKEYTPEPHEPGTGKQIHLTSRESWLLGRQKLPETKRQIAARVSPHIKTANRCVKHRTRGK